jgi:hypothetical protein
MIEFGTRLLKGFSMTLQTRLCESRSTSSDSHASGPLPLQVTSSLYRLAQRLVAARSVGYMMKGTGSGIVLCLLEGA